MTGPTTPSLPRRMSDAYHAGKLAATTERIRRNPYNGASPFAVERVLAKMWGRGHSDGNPMPDPGAG